VLRWWYSRKSGEQVAELLAKREPQVGVTIADWGIKKTKTRRASRIIEARRI